MSGADPKYIKRVVDLLHEPGAVVELRCLKTKAGTTSGYFNDFNKLAEAAAKLSGAVPAAYVTLNPCKPDLLARANNRLEKYAKSTTADNDILRRRWLPMDFDAVRPADISSTDSEHTLALQRAKECRLWLATLGFPDGVLADSGNGAHLLYGIDLPNDDASRTLIQTCLEALAAQFSDDKVVVDVKNFNAARIWKLYGTMVCKGDNLPERPHRRAKIIEAKGAHFIFVELLKKLAALAPQPVMPTHTNERYQRFNLDDFISLHGIQVKRESSWNGGRRIILEACPWNSDHNRGEAFIVQLASGAIGAGCHHNSCSGKRWPELREIYEPQYRERQRSREQTHVPNKEPSKRGDGHPWSPVTVRIADVTREEITWLWTNRIPRNKLTLIQGDPGNGKSFLSLAIATAVTRGHGLRGDTLKREPQNVLIMSAEDGVADTIRPRLEDMGADLERVFSLRACVNEAGEEKTVTLADLPVIEAAIVQHRPDLVIIDPIIAFTADKDTHKANEVRSLLAPLAMLAEKYGVAVIAIQHLNKGNGKAVYRGQGSIDFLAACRAAFLCGPDPDNQNVKAFVHVKANLSSIAPTLTYTIQEGRFRWIGESDLTADQVLAAPGTGQARTELDEAREFLRTLLADGPVDRKRIEKERRAAGISEITCRRAKEAEGINVRRDGFGPGGKWVWELSPKVLNINSYRSKKHNHEHLWGTERPLDSASTQDNSPSSIDTHSPENGAKNPIADPQNGVSADGEKMPVGDGFEEVAEDD